MLRGGEGKDQPGAVLNEAADVGERAVDLALGFSDRPQPGGVDVRVPDGREAVCAGKCRALHDGLEDVAGRGGRAGDVVQIELVERVVEGVQDLEIVMPKRLALSLDHLGEHLDVEDQFGDLRVAYHDVGLLKHVHILA